MSAADKFAKRHLFLEEGMNVRDMKIPYDMVINLMEVFHAKEIQKKQFLISEMKFPSDNEIIQSAKLETKNEKGRGAIELFLIQIGFEIGAKWILKIIKKNWQAQQVQIVEESKEVFLEQVC